MKKILLFILLFILIPLNINAAEIIDTEIMGMTEKMIGEELSLSFKVRFSGIEKGDDKTLGIWIAGFELIFDEDVLMVSGISSTDFDSYVYKEDGKYYVFSEVIENGPSHNNCVNGVLYCADYLVTVKFYLKNTELTETTIKMGEIEIGLLDMIDENKTYTLDDLITLNTISDKSHTIKINKPIEEIKETPTDITTNNNPITEVEKEITIDKNIENKKSSNAFIKNIKIDDYKLEFEKNKTNYNLTVLENVNELDIDVTLEDENATYKIIGADDLKNNNNEVAVIVTAEDNSTLTYTINIKYSNETEENISEENLSKEKLNLKDVINKYLTKKNLTYAAIGLGIIIIIILIIILKNKRENKKINKLLGEL